MSRGWIGVESSVDFSPLALAWAAGFFDGEGSLYVRHTRRHKGGNGRDYPLTTVEMSVCQVEPSPLERFLETVKTGTLRGPYVPRGNQRPYYRWQTAGRPSVHRVVEMLWPYLCDPKKAQIKRAWAELEALKTVKSPALPPLPEDDLVLY